MCARVFRSDKKTQRDTVCWVDDAVLQHSSDSQLVFSLYVTLNALLKSTVKEETQVLFGLFSSQARTGLDWNGAGIEA